jgi:hypothetical protein
MGVDFQSDHRFMFAGNRVHKAAERCIKLVVINDVAANQNITSAHQIGKAGAHVIVHVHGKAVDGDIGKHRFFLTSIGAGRGQKADGTDIIFMRRINGGQGVGHEGR